MASSNDAPQRQQINNTHLTVEEIINSIPTLIDQLSKVKDTILPPTSNHNINNGEGNTGDANTNPSNGQNNNNIGNQENGSIGNSTISKMEKDMDESDNSGSNLSCWSFGICHSHKDNTVSGHETNDSSLNSGSNRNNVNSEEIRLQLHKQLEKLERDLSFIKSSLTKIKDLQHFVSIQFSNLEKLGQDLDTICSNTIQSPNLHFSAEQLQYKIRSLNEIIMKLKLQIPLPQKISATNLESNRPQTGQEVNARNLIDERLQLHANKNFTACSAFKVVQENFELLKIECKLCLLCFAVFPENAIVKKRLLLYWWVGEGFVDPENNDGAKTAAEIVDGILKDFILKGFIEPEIKKKRLVGFRMHPLVRYSVISLAAKIGFLDFDRVGNPTAKFDLCQRACLVNTEDGSSRRELMNNLESHPAKVNLGKLQTLFNVNDPYPDFKLEWFLRMKNLNVLCLGRWQSSAKHHIEVEDTELLRGLKNMKYLKFLSLQGISRINELPDSICKLINLSILDLNACHNLDTLPEIIGQLKMLTHLDISECYLLDHLPKGIGLLSKLEVLKGFVISDVKSRSSCTLDDLAKLRKLMKLSIHTNKKGFPAKEELTALHHLKALRKLTIAWAGKSIQENLDNSPEQKNCGLNSTEDGTGNAKVCRNSTLQDSGDAQPAIIRSFTKQFTRVLLPPRETRSMKPELPPNLEKLDLQCFPGTGAPNWLMPGNLKHLNKLYIRGGNLHNLVQAQEQNKWAVKILRLKFLLELKMEWRELQRLFPNLIYLEKVKCPKLTLFPCDERGLWLNRTMIPKQSLEGEVGFNWSFLAGRPT